MPSFRFRTAAVLLAAGAALCAAALPAQARALPGQLRLRHGRAGRLLVPADAAAGADNFGCQPSAAHPDPVILVNGTFANQDDNWQAASPLLANHGYCVFTFNYGGTSASAVVQGTGDIAASAGQLAAFVTQVLAATGAAKVDLVGHSQGGMMPRYYLKFLGGAAVRGPAGRAGAQQPRHHPGRADRAGQRVRRGRPGERRAERAVHRVRAAGGGLGVPGQPERGRRHRGRGELHGHRVAVRRGGHAVHLGVPVRPRGHQHHAAEPVRARPERPPGDRGRPGRAGRRAERARPGAPGARPMPVVLPITGPVGPVPSF